MQKAKNKKANALITVLAVLLVISTMAVSFARIAGSERLAASNYGQALKARLLSEAGINFAVSQLRRDFQQEIMCTVQAFTDKTGEQRGERRWTYTVLNDSNPANPTTEDDMINVEDDMAAGIPIEELQRVSIDNPITADATNPQLISPHPSYALLNQADNLPLPIAGSNLIVSRNQNTLPNTTIPTYTLKILSLNSQIDLNSQTPQFGQAVESLHLATMLNNLSVAVAKREPYKTIFAADPDLANGPLFGTLTGNEGDPKQFLGQEILKLRDKLLNKSFRTKFQILELPGIDREKMVYFWDFICANPQQQGVIARPVDLQNVPGVDDINNPSVNELEEYRGDRRAPINMNLAPWPVLVATFQGLECIDSTGEKIEITRQDAEALAARICRERRRPESQRKDVGNNIIVSMQYPFVEWEKFKRYMSTNQNEASDIIGAKDVFSGTAEQKRKKAMLVYAMADPNTHLRRTNPDTVLFQEINKTDITKPTLELSFYPHGIFEITSLGQVITLGGEIVDIHKRQTVVKIFDIIKKNSQEQFNFEHTLASTIEVPVGSFKEINSYSSGNNINLIDHIAEGDVFDMISNEFGHIAPVNFDNKFLGPIVDENTTVADGGAVTFKCNYNGDNLVDLGSGPQPVEPFQRSLNADFPIPGASIDAPLGGKILTPSNGLVSKKVSNLILPKEQDSGDPEDIGDLASDGVIFHENPDTQFTDGGVSIKEDRTLNYLTKKNLPMPLDITGPETDGTVSFWFKLNKNQNWSKFRTIFLATSPMSDDTKGVQMEIQMKIDSGDLVVQARRKFYNISPPPEEDPDADPLDILLSLLAGVPDQMLNIDSGAQRTFKVETIDGDDIGIQEHEWYHLTVRWTNITLIDATDIILSGRDVDQRSIGLYQIENPFTEATTPLPVNLLADVTVENSSAVFAPIEPAEVATVDTARMYFGAVKRTYDFGTANEKKALFSSALTLDDIRILNKSIPNNITVSRYAPTGFQNTLPDSTIMNVVGLFSGKFSGIDGNRSVLGVFDWTRRVPVEFSDGSFSDAPFTQGEFPIEDFGDENNVSTSTEYITGYDPKNPRAQILVKKFEGIEERVLDVLYDEVLGPDKGEAFFGRQISSDEFRRLFAKDMKKAWNKFAKEENKGKGKRDKKFPKLEQIKDFKIFGIVIFSAQSRARFILDRNSDLLAILKLLREEVREDLSGTDDDDDDDDDTSPAVVGNGIVAVEFPVDEVPEEELQPAIQKAVGFIDDVTGKAFAAKAINPLDAPLIPIAKAVQDDPNIDPATTNLEKVIITPENADFEYNLAFLQRETEDGSSDIKVAFSSPVIDDVTISYQAKVIFFYNIELLD